MLLIEEKIQISFTTFVFNLDSTIFKINSEKSNSRVPLHVLHLLTEKKINIKGILCLQNAKFRKPAKFEF